MICGKCALSKSVPGTGMIKCSITNETRLPADVCNCEDRRIMRYREIEVAANRENILNDLHSLRDRLVGDRPNINYVYNTLLEITTEVTSDKLTELVQYLSKFIKGDNSNDES